MERITHNVVQGSDEWVLLRCQYYGASEAAAMLGISKKTTRTELLNARAGFSEKQFSDFVQRMILDKGHEVEALARPIVEEIISDELYPVTMSCGMLSASCDGLTLDGAIAWECKQYNEEYFNLVKSGELPAEHRPQCQQVLLVTGAKKLYFTISDGTPEKTAGIWIYPDQFYFDKIQEGWEQFTKDKDSHQYVYHKQAIAEPIMQLPALSVQIRGEVTLSNLPQFKAAAETFIANIKTDLQTDEDFAQAEETVKFCDKAEKELEIAKRSAIAQTSTIDELMRAIDNIKDQLRSKRLMLDKLVKTQKDAIKASIINNARELWIDHVKSLSQEISPISLNIAPPDFASAIKNKRTLASIHDAINTELANSKIKADALAKELRSKISWYNAEASEFLFLFLDINQLIYKADDDFKLAVTARIDRHKKETAEKLEAERARIRAEEEVKARVASEKLIAENEPPAPAPAPAPAPITILSKSKFISQDIPLNIFPSVDEVIHAVADRFFSSNLINARIFLCNTDFSLK